MATCPHCGKYLGTHHRCRGRWKRRLRVVAIGLCGAILGAVLPFASSNYEGHPWLVVMTMVVGAAITIGIWKAIP